MLEGYEEGAGDNRAVVENGKGECGLKGDMSIKACVGDGQGYGLW